MIVILMGVSGSGKTTISQRLANALGWQFYDGDIFHTHANVEKLKQGIALTDADRIPWLTAIRLKITELLETGQSAVLACSALKREYRNFLSGGNNIRFIYLKGSYSLISKRLENRHNHFMNPNLLSSQFDVLEEPEGVSVIDINQEPDVIVNQIKGELQH